MRLVVFFFLLLAGSAHAQTIELAPGEMLLKVESTGAIMTAPDRASFDAAVVTTGETATAAIEANNILANRLVGALRDSRHSISSIETRTLSVEPRFRADRNNRYRQSSDIVGYVAENRIVVTFDDMDDIPAVYALLSENGANEIEGPDLLLADPEQAMRRVRAAAVAEARREAEDYAEAFGMRVDRILQASEREPTLESSSGAIVVTANRIITPFEIGEVEASVDLWVDFVLVPE